MSERDVVAEVLAIIDAETAHGDFDVTDVARTIVDKLRATDPELLLLFLDEEAVRIVAHLLRRTEHRRKQALRTGRRSVFSETMTEHDREIAENGRRSADPPAAAASWLARQYSTAEGRRRHLGDCNADDLQFNIDRYRDRSRRNEYEAAWLAAIQRKVGDGTVADHFTDEQLSAMRH